MPFYEYVCTSCGASTEILQKISDPPATECPACHAQALSKQISAAGFRLKGGGWYETDFKSGGQRNLVGDKAGGEAAKADGAQAGSSGGHGCAAGACGCAPKSAETKAETKTETKSESKPAASPPATTAA
jgi:putative FmdB family regulatory protein